MRGFDFAILFMLSCFMVVLIILARKQTRFNNMLFTGMVQNHEEIKKLPRQVIYKKPRSWRAK